MNEMIFEEGYKALKEEISIYFENSVKFDAAKIFAIDSKGEEYRIETISRNTPGKCNFELTTGGIITKMMNGGKMHLNFLPFTSILSLSVELFSEKTRI